MSNLAENNDDTLNNLLQKIINNLDIWRSILYSIVLGGITISNIDSLRGLKLNYLSDYIILLFACLLIIFDPINRYLYRDFTIRKIDDKTNVQSELWFVFAIFGIEIAALFGLCFGVYKLGKLAHQHYLFMYFLSNFFLNISEFWVILKKTPKEDGSTFNFIEATKKIFNGEIEFFFFGNKNITKFKGWSSISEQYLAFNTLFFSLWLYILLQFYDFWYRCFSKPQVAFVISFILIIILTIIKVRCIESNHLLGEDKKRERTLYVSILLFISFLVFFTSWVGLCGKDYREWFIVGCLSHYVLVSFFYLRLYIVELFERIPKLKESN